RDALHDQIEDPVLGPPTIEQSRDVGMIETREHLALAPEPLDEIVSFERRMQNLDCHFLLELTVIPARPVDAAHPAAPDLFSDLVGADATTDPALALVIRPWKEMRGRRPVEEVTLFGV